MNKTTLIRKWSPKRPGYWKLYHQSHEHDMFEVFKAICELVERFEPPWEISSLGKPVKILPEQLGYRL